MKYGLGKYMNYKEKNINLSSGIFFHENSTRKSTSYIIRICGNLSGSNIFQIPCDEIYSVDTCESLIKYIDPHGIMEICRIPHIFELTHVVLRST